MQKLSILAPLALLLSIAGGKEAFSKYSYLINVPYNFRVAWNESYKRLAVSTLPGPITTTYSIKTPDFTFRSFTLDRSTALRGTHYYYTISVMSKFKTS